MEMKIERKPDITQWAVAYNYQQNDVIRAKMRFETIEVRGEFVRCG